MDDINFFDPHAYFRRLTEQNKLAQLHQFKPCSCSGIDSLDDMLTEFRSTSAFVCVDDTNNAATENRGGGWFKHRVFTVFLLIRYRFDDMADRKTKLNICRQLFRQMHSRMIRDKAMRDNELTYLNVDRVMSREIGRYFMSGCTGLYFTVDDYEPINLVYDAGEWQDGANV